MNGREVFRSRSRIVAAAGALALVVGGGAAYAASTTQQAGGAHGAIVAAIGGDLGISASELRSDLASGQTLAQIAAANGQPVSGLEQAILTAAQSRLDEAVATGKLTSQAEQSLLGRLDSRLGQLLNAAHPGALVRRALRRAAFVRLSASYLGVTPPQLRSDLRAGSSLAQVATDNGKTVAGLEQAVGSAVSNRLDQAVAAGQLSSQREQAMLLRVQARLSTLVNRSFAD